MKSPMPPILSLTQFSMISILLFISLARAANIYQLDTSYSGSTFFNGFDFFTVSPLTTWPTKHKPKLTNHQGPDPTLGFVE